jgi:hypothetical protein
MPSRFTVSVKVFLLSAMVDMITSSVTPGGILTTPLQYTPWGIMSTPEQRPCPAYLAPIVIGAFKGIAPVGPSSASVSSPPG